MGNNTETAKKATGGTGSRQSTGSDGALEACLHPAWRAFIRYCVDLRYGEIADLKIQDGLPLLAEVTKKKVKFT